MTSFLQSEASTSDMEQYVSAAAATGAGRRNLKGLSSQLEVAAKISQYSI